MITNSDNEFPFLKSYKKKSECRIFIEDTLNLIVPFVLVVGSILLISFLISFL